jgi:hypothetical protein
MEEGRSENFSIKQLRTENVKLLQILIKFMNSQLSYLQKKIRLEVPDTKLYKMTAWLKSG